MLAEGPGKKKTDKDLWDEGHLFTDFDLESTIAV